MPQTHRMLGPASREARWKRIGWFIGLWLAGVASIAGLSYLIRWAILP